MATDRQQKPTDGKYNSMNRLYDSNGTGNGPLAAAAAVVGNNSTVNSNLGYGASNASSGTGSAALEEIFDSFCNVNMQQQQQHPSYHQQQHQGGNHQFMSNGCKPSSGVIGSARPGLKSSINREITSDFDLSLSSTGSSLDSPPQDAIAALTNLGYISSDALTADAIGNNAAVNAFTNCSSYLHVRTPLIESRALSKALGIPNCKVWLKLENTQPTGSFKLRGIGLMVKRAVERGCDQVISSSGGNAGLAAAYAANKLCIRCTVVVPESTPEEMRARISDEGAQVIVHGKVWLEAHTKAEALLAQNARSVLVHPYEHKDIWDGHSTMIDEIAESLNGEQPDGVVVAVGGGGLLCGVINGLLRYGWVTTPVFAAETRGADCLAAAIKANGPTPLPKLTSRATSLGASQLSQQAWDYMREHPVHSVLCNDDEAAHAAINFLQQHQMLTELACGAALAAVYKRSVAQHSFAKSHPTNLIVIVCGGRNVNVQQLMTVAGDSSK